MMPVARHRESMTQAVARGGRYRRARAGLLLEVVVSLTVLVASMGLLGAQLVRGYDMTLYSEEQLRTSHVVERVMALIEFDPETQELLFETGESELTHDFNETDPDMFWRARDQFPGYFWRVDVQPVDVDDPDPQLFRVVVEILLQRDKEELDSMDGADVVRRLAFLRAKPAQLDLTELELNPDALGDLNLPEDVLAQFPDLMALLSTLNTGGGVNLQQLAGAFDQETLQSLIPLIQALVAQNGGVMPDFGGMLNQFGGGGMLNAEGLGGGAEGAAALQALREAAEQGGGMPPGAGRGGRGGGRNPGGARGGQPAAGGRRNNPTPRSPGGAQTLSGGSGEGGRFTIEDLMRMREEARNQGGG